MNTSKPIKTTAVVFLLAITLFACVKKDDPAKFTINIDDSPWRLREAGIDAIYYSNAHILYFTVSDGTKWFYLSVDLNATVPVSNYVFEPLGNNSARLQIENVPDEFISDNNVPDAGGSFSLTAFDTSQKKLSCNFRLTCYGGDRVSKRVVSSTLSNVSFKIDSLKYNNTMACTINGVKMINWQTKAGTFLGFPSSGVDFRFSSMTGFHGLYFAIPFSYGTGSYPLKPGAIFSFSPDSIYAGYYLDSAYYPTSGTINITRMDVAQRKMEANFNLDLKDSRGDRIQITNGSFTVNRWVDQQ